VNELLGRLIAFKGDDEFCEHTTLPVEVTTVNKDGYVELTFAAPIPGKPQFYLSFNLSRLVQIAVAAKPEDA
jgi:hypothetical protein